jgi:hypothetical protein
MDIDQTDHAIPLPHLSDEAAVEILNFLEVTYQIFDTRYAAQIRRFYDGLAQHNIVSSHPTNVPEDDPPF